MYVRVAPYRLVRTRKARSDWLIMGAVTYTGEPDVKSSVIRILVWVGGRDEVKVVPDRMIVGSRIDSTLPLRLER